MLGDFEDTTDFENADRGFIASIDVSLTDDPDPNFTIVTP